MLVNIRLKTLDLSDNNLRDDGANYIVHALKHNTIMQSLNFRNDKKDKKKDKISLECEQSLLTSVQELNSDNRSSAVIFQKL